MITEHVYPEFHLYCMGHELKSSVPTKHSKTLHTDEFLQNESEVTLNSVSE